MRRLRCAGIIRPGSTEYQSRCAHYSGAIGGDLRTVVGGCPRPRRASRI